MSPLEKNISNAPTHSGKPPYFSRGGVNTPQTYASGSIQSEAVEICSRKFQLQPKNLFSREKVDSETSHHIDQNRACFRQNCCGLLFCINFGRPNLPACFHHPEQIPTVASFKLVSRNFGLSGF